MSALNSILVRKLLKNENYLMVACSVGITNITGKTLKNLDSFYMRRIPKEMAAEFISVFDGFWLFERRSIRRD
jgi:hypothetical protein